MDTPEDMHGEENPEVYADEAYFTYFATLGDHAPNTYLILGVLPAASEEYPDGERVRNYAIPYDEVLKLYVYLKEKLPSLHGYGETGEHQLALKQIREN